MEAEICDLASRIAIATHEWLRLIVAFDRREGWRTCGCRSTAQWLSWRCGMSLSAAYEHLRVGRALENLPKVAAEFAAGRLSYSKVRALTRIADADQRSSQADRPTTGDKTTNAGKTKGAGTSETADETGRRAQHAEPEANGEPGATTPAKHPPDTAGTSDQGPQGHADAEDDHGYEDDEDATAEDAEADAEDELLNLARSATASQLDRIARGCAAARSKDQNLRRAMRRGVWWYTDDDGSLVIRGRLAPDEGAVVVAALEAALDTLLARKPGPPAPTTSPEPASPSAEAPVQDRDSAGSGNSTNPAPGGSEPTPPPNSDSSAEEPPPDQTPPNDPPPDGTPRAIPHRHRGALAADALVLMAETLLTNTPAFLNSADKYRIIVHLTPAAAPGTATAPHHPASLDDGTPLPPETTDRLACEATVTNLHLGHDGQIHGLSDPTRFPRTATARAVRIRAHHTCQAPSCTTRRGLQIHHVRHWSHGGPTSLNNLILICRYHHWLAHEGNHTFTAHPDGTFTFHRPDGTEIPATPPLPGPTKRPAHTTTDHDHDHAARSALHPWINPHQPLDQDALTPPWWSGDPLDLHYAISVILDTQAAPN
ncbi:DUF222 domain-containing protein [Actinopolymorpha sp. NPDC004070]|uniref:HNH endonuclease signature motif containing protein n=1 Tax=Actinopolymorpha sp. NPDC004070 TaxID=3154548 RepID=UPI0033B4293A